MSQPDTKKTILNRKTITYRERDKDKDMKELTSIINDFGIVSYNKRDYIINIFNNENISKSLMIKQNLENKANITNNYLKDYVTDNYKKFIDTSKEIVNIESDMLNLNTLLNEYSNILKSLQGPNSRFECKNTNINNIHDNSNQQVSEDTKALHDLSEELGGLLFERKFEQAVSIIEAAYEKMDELDIKAIKSARSQVDHKVTQLIEMVTFELQSPTLKASERRKYTQYLIRLGHPDKALQVFLQNRSFAIKADIRKIKFQGDLSVYISELSTVVTSAIASTCNDFRKLFVDRDMMSGFVVWAVSELESFGVIFQRQVFHNDTPIAKIGECMKLAFTASKTLDQNGLKIGFVLASRFASHLAETIDKEYNTMEQQLVVAIEEENWVSAELYVRAPKQPKDRTRKGSLNANTSSQQRSVKLTESAKLLYDLIHRLISNLKLLLNNQLYPQTSSELYVPIVQGIIRLFEKYLLKMTEASRLISSETANIANTEEDAQELSIVANTFYLADDLLPRVSRQYEKQFERPVPELEQFQFKLTRLYKALRDQYCQRRVNLWLMQAFHWESVFINSYIKESLDEDIMVASPSPELFRFVKFLCHIRDLVTELINADAASAILAKSLEEIFLQLTDDESYWKYGDFGRGGLQQFTLDIKALLAAAEAFLTENAEDAAESLLTKAILLYSNSKNVDPAKVKFNNIWFTSIIDQKLTEKIGSRQVIESPRLIIDD